MNVCAKCGNVIQFDENEHPVCVQCVINEESEKELQSIQNQLNALNEKKEYHQNKLIYIVGKIDELLERKTQLLDQLDESEEEVADALTE